MSDELCDIGAVKLLKAYKSGEFSPVDVANAVLARIRRLNDKYRAFCFLDPETTILQAEESAKRWKNSTPKGLLDGIPVTIKDLILTKKWPTLRGSLTTNQSQDWIEDAPCVARLREHGAVFLGKTTTPEFGWKAVTDSPLTGVTYNPWNLDRTPGGSSGGAAVAALLGMGVMHIGTDGGGSVRIPASFSGVFGFKASSGRVPLYPPSPFGTLAHVGPITRTVEDAALMLRVITEPDSRDSSSLAFEPRNYSVSISAGISGLRIAYSPNLGYVSVDSDVNKKVFDAVKVFETLGAQVDQVDPGFTSPQNIFQTHWYTGAAYLLHDLDELKRLKLDPGLEYISSLGANVTLSEFFEASQARAKLTALMKKFHENYDLLITPTMPTTAFRLGKNGPIGDNDEYWDSLSPFTYPFNLTGQPAATLPCGFGNDGLPIGLQIIGKNYDDVGVLRAASAYFDACPEHTIFPPGLKNK